MNQDLVNYRWNRSETFSPSGIEEIEQRIRPLSHDRDALRQVITLWYEHFASTGMWSMAEKLAKLATETLPEEPFGWEDRAWAMHKQGRTKKAYDYLVPIHKYLKLPSPPSGRGAYCLACFSAILEKTEEAQRWLQLAFLLAEDKDTFRSHCLREPALTGFWPFLQQLSVRYTFTSV